MAETEAPPMDFPGTDPQPEVEVEESVDEALVNAEPVTYSWLAPTEVTDPEAEAEKYEAELDELLDSDASSWGVLGEEDGSLLYRMTTGTEKPGYLCRYVTEIPSSESASELMKRLMSVDGFYAIDNMTPREVQEESWNNPIRTFEYKGIPGFVTAPACKLPSSTSDSLDMCVPNTVWFTDTTLYNWPAFVDVADRLPSCQETKMDYVMTYAINLTDAEEPGMVTMKMLMWASIVPVGDYGKNVLRMYAAALKNNMISFAAGEGVAQPAEEVAEDPEAPVEEPIEEPVEEPVEELVEEPVEEPVEELVEEPVEEPVEQYPENTEVIVEEPTSTVESVPADEEVPVKY